MTRFLALDPSSREWGWAFFEDGELVHAGGCRSTMGSYGDRFKNLEWQLEELLGRYGFTELAYEGGSWGKFKVSALQVAIMTIRHWCRGHKVLFWEYSPTAVKRGVTGSGRASKEELARVICLQWGVADGLPQHVYDAIAVGQVHLGWQRMREMEVKD